MPNFLVSGYYIDNNQPYSHMVANCLSAKDALARCAADTDAPHLLMFVSAVDLTTLQDTPELETVREASEFLTDDQDALIDFSGDPHDRQNQGAATGKDCVLQV